MIKNTLLRWPALLLLALCFLTLSAEAQDARDILQHMADMYTDQTKEIADYTVTTDQFTTYFKKYEKGGKPYFKTHTKVNGIPSGLASFMSGGSFASDPRMRYTELADHATYVGEETVDGRSCYVVRITDFPREAGDEEGPERVDLYVDTEHYVPLKMAITARKEINDEKKVMNIEMRFDDYRTVEGLRYPFRTRIIVPQTENKVSKEDLERAKKSIAEFDKKLAEMPKAQADMMRKMMGPRLAPLRKMLESGTLGMELVVTDLKVNTGLKDALFQSADAQ